MKRATTNIGFPSGSIIILIAYYIRIILGILQQIEYIFGVPLLTKLFPLYYFLKSLLLIWLMAPQFQGSFWIWKTILHWTFPAVKGHIESQFHQEKKPAAAPVPPQAVPPPKNTSFLDLGKISYSR